MTTRTGGSVEDFLEGVEDGRRRADARMDRFVFGVSPELLSLSVAGAHGDPEQR